MSDNPRALTLRVCHLPEKHIEQRVLDALSAATVSYEEHYGTLSSGNLHEPITYDCLLIDWRDADVEVANYFSSLAGSEPVIALINADQAIHNSELIMGFSDFVCVEEIGFAPFAVRLQRLVSRYKDPLNFKTAKGPEARLIQKLVNYSSDWVFIKDLDHRFLAVSEAYAVSLERTLDDVIGKNDLDVGFSQDVVLGSEKDDWEGFWPQDDYAVSHGEPTIETNPYWRVFTGDTRHRQTVRVPLKNHWGEAYALLICSEDVTAIVKTEQVLRERSEMLEKVTQEKLKAEHSRLMAELAVTAKNKFIATASHDLRQPLHALGLYLDVLASKVRGQEQQILIAKIKNSSIALSALFNSLLDLSRLEAGVVDVEPTHFKITALLGSLREEFEEVAADKHLYIGVQSSIATLYTDPVLVERILRNLIQNAVTYTEVGSVEVRCIEQANVLRIEISDTGPGIPQYEQNAIFSEYYQLEHEGRSPTIGLGLGLAIVRRLVDLLDIKFELHSEDGNGSVFSLELPLGDADRIVEQRAVGSNSELKGQTVLIIDDEVEILDALTRVLESHGCKPVAAVSVLDAMQKLTAQDVVPSVIVADYRLRNDQRGDAAIEWIREEFNSDIPAIIVTGDTSSDRLREATSSGFRLLHKPVQPNELVNEISLLLLARKDSK